MFFLSLGTPYASLVHAQDPQGYQESYVPADVAGTDSASPYADDIASDLDGTTGGASVAGLSALEASDPARAAALRDALAAQASNPTVTPISLPSGQAKSAVTPQAISLPSAEGSIQGMGESFSPVLSSGTGTFSVPIALPPGRVGVQPSLGLSYSSSSGNGDVGIGWSIGMPFISRQTDRGLPRYDDRPAWHPEEDRFFYNGGQELVPVSNEQAAALDGGTIPPELMTPTRWQQYRARVEGGFMRFFRAPDYMRWIVQAKDGTRFDFGLLPVNTYPSDYGDLRTTLQTENADGTGRIFRWQLTRQSDTHGSTIYYRYLRDDGQIYTYDIHYVSPAGCGGAGPQRARECTEPLASFSRRVKFAYDTDRPDANRSYVTGFRVRTAWRMRLIQVTGWNHIASERTLVRRYWLSYDASSFHSLLSSIQVEGRPQTANAYGAMVGDATISESALGDTVVGERLPAMRFSYSRQDATVGDVPGFGGLNSVVHTAGASPNHSADEAMTDLFDVNSDGLPDVIVTDPATYRTAAGRPAVGVFFNGFSGSDATPAASAGTFSEAVPMAVPDGLSGVMRLSNANVVPMDIDGDGRSDLLHMPRIRNYGYFTPVRRLADVTTVAAVSPAQQGWEWHYVPVALPAGDLDPRIDLTRDAQHIRALDVNNDHLVDVVRTTGTGIQTWLNLGWIPGGDGRFGSAHHDGTRWVMSTEPTESCLLFEGTSLDFEDPEVRLADMNGDGLQDIAKIRRGRVYYWPGRGLGIWGEGSFECARGEGAGRTVEMANPPPIDFDADGTFLEDVDGDGTSDVVQTRFREVAVWFNRAGESFTPESVRLTSTPHAPGFAPRIRFTDIDGTGTGDIVWANAGRWQWIDFMGGVRPRLLTGVANGLGATTTMAYGSSAVEYLRDLRHAQTCNETQDADDGCYRWSGARLGCDDGGTAGNCDYEDVKSGGYRSGGSPVVSSVVKTVATSDHFNAPSIRREETVAESEFSYHDAYYEGIEQEFRGFGAAEATAIGDEFHPTSVAVTRFHQGRRPNALASDRTRDNPDEALKGREWLTEAHDGNPAGPARQYLSTTHAAYTVRRLMTGLNGVAVSYAYVRSTEDVKYDLRRWNATSTPRSVGGVIRETALTTGGDMPRSGVTTDAEFPSYGHQIVLRGEFYAIVGSEIVRVDHLGDLLEQRALGRVVGEYGEAIGQEEVITSQSVPVNLFGESGWLWRTQSSWVEGHDPLTGGVFLPPAPATTYAPGTGDVLTETELVRADWDFEFGPGTDGSLAYRSGDQTIMASTSYDAWGNAVESCDGGDVASEAHACLHYSTVAYDPQYAQFPSSETTATGYTPGENLRTGATFDEGLGGVLTVTDPNMASTSVTFDGLGRVTSLTPPALGHGDACTRPATVVEYFPTASPTTMPASRVHTTTFLTCGGSTTQVLDGWKYFDGAGTARATLVTGDEPGEWIQSGIAQLTKRGTPLRAYQNAVVESTDPAPALAIPSVARSEARYDAFGRQFLEIAPDGAQTVTSYHALSKDVCDPLDNDPSSFASGTCTTERTDGHGRMIDQTVRNRQSRAAAIEYYRLWSYYRPDGEIVALVRAQSDESQVRPVIPSDTTGQSARIVRYFFYDSAGRRLGATDPDSDSRSAGRTAANRTWRYHFNRLGDLVAMRDPRGCGQNYFYDRAGRMVGEDYVLCDEAQATPEVSLEYVPAGMMGSETLDAPEGVDVRYYFDAYPSELTSDVFAGTPTADAPPPTSYLSYALGRATAVTDRGQRSVVIYDARGNGVWTGRQMAVIGDAGPVPATLDGPAPLPAMTDVAPSAPIVYDARTYVRSATFDFGNRPKSLTLPSNPDSSTGTVVVGGALTYNHRGLPDTAKVVFADGTAAWERPVVVGTLFNANGLVTSVTYGDGSVGRSATRSETAYDLRNRPVRMWTARAPTGSTTQTLSAVTMVADQQLVWDAADNIREIEDDRVASEWPAGSRPQTTHVEHDALYRVTHAYFEYAGGEGGNDAATDWRAAVSAPHPGDAAAPTAREADPMRTDPAPLVSQLPAQRVRDLTWSYDWLGNMTEWNGDGSGGFYERYVGDIRNGYGDGDHRPGALYFAGDFDAPAGERGYVELDYGEAGNVLAMTVHAQCANASGAECAAPGTPYGDPSGGPSDSARRAAAHATCACAVEQHYQYRWDELSRLAEARRYDRSGTVSATPWSLKVRQRYRYDSGNQRTMKQTLETVTDTVGGGDGVDDIDGDSPERLTLYVYTGDFERRGLTRNAGRDGYESAKGKVGAAVKSIAESQYLVAGARVVWQAVSPGTAGTTPNGDGALQKAERVSLGLADIIGTTSAVLDLESGELVEASTYYPNGARETYLRGADANDESVAPEPKGFTGKEADEEVGVTYFGERYLISRLGRWASPDPLQVHAGGGGETGNSYHYISGNLLKGRDPIGLQDRSGQQSSAAPSTAAGVGNNDILYIGFGRDAPSEIAALTRSLGANGHVIAITNAGIQKFDVNGHGVTLASLESDGGYGLMVALLPPTGNAAGDRPDQIQAARDIIMAPPSRDENGREEPPNGRDELARLAGFLASVEDGRARMPSRVVISGHHVAYNAPDHRGRTDGFYGDVRRDGDHGNVGVFGGQLTAMFRVFSGASAQVRQLHVAACNGGFERDVREWRKAFTGLRGFWGYVGTAPAASSGGASHLRRWEIGSRTGTPTAALAGRTRRADNIATWSQSGYVGPRAGTQRCGGVECDRRD
jgi:RHS repeat-associated protein